MDILEYYASQSEFTDPGPFAEHYAGLPSSVEGICQTVSEVMLDFMDRWKHPIQNERWLETNIRYVDEMIEAIRLMDKKNPVIFYDHPDDAKMMASSSHFVALAVSIMRAKGIPARKRAGYVSSGEFFKEYGIENKFMAYDVAEVYVDGQWKIVDVEGRGETFIPVAQVYKNCRAGSDDAALYYDDENNGIDAMIAVLIHDFDACAKAEMLTWDRYGLMDKPVDEYTDDDWALLDKVADLLINNDKDVDAIDALYKAEKRLQVSRIIFCDTPLVPPHKMVTRVIE